MGLCVTEGVTDVEFDCVCDAVSDGLRLCERLGVRVNEADIAWLSLCVWVVDSVLLGVVVMLNVPSWVGDCDCDGDNACEELCVDDGSCDPVELGVGVGEGVGC